MMNLCAHRVFSCLKPALTSLRKTPTATRCVQPLKSLTMMSLNVNSAMNKLSRQVHHIACASARSSLCLQYDTSVQNSLGVSRSQAIRRTQLLGPNVHFTHPIRAASKIPTDAEKTLLVTEMNMRLMNENSFLSWCRNAYLSTVVGVAMITEGTTALAQGAGAGALTVGAMNLFWGTGCHVVNLIRLRHVTGMSSFTLFLNLLGSTLHCCLWLFVLICYIGFLDETRSLSGPGHLDSPVEVTNVLLDSKNGLSKDFETMDV